MPLFHVAPTLLAPGSIIQPGNFGRILGMYTMQDASSLYYREQILEQIRQSNYPQKPSRLRSAFCLETLTEAQIFRSNALRRPADVIYEVELVEENCKLHRGDYVKVGPQNSDLASKMQQAAHDYWQAQSIQHIEIVAESGLRILQRIP